MPAAAALSTHLQWLNCDPLPLEHFRGHPLLIAFWNVSSGTSQTMMQWFAQTAHRNRGKAGFLAVHVPKFESERDGVVARRWMEALGVSIPLVNDVAWAAWQRFNVEAWPTTLLLDANGKVCRSVVGDRDLDTIGDALESLIDASFLRASGVVHMPALRPASAARLLSMPMGLAVTANKLFIADTCRHRILECSQDGRILRRIGSGQADLLDGNEREAGFRFPRALAVVQDKMYIADSGNHAVRVMDMRLGQVETLLGSGRGDDPRAVRVQQARDATLDRPVALACDGKILYVGMAGTPQVWAFDLVSREFTRVAGSGEFGFLDGKASVAQFAQPGALAVVGDQLWVLDSGSSALRRVGLADGAVATSIGRGVFEFGQQDGTRRKALMQGPLGMVLEPDGGNLWVADTGNRAIRLMSLQSNVLTTAIQNVDWTMPTAMARAGGAIWVLDAGADAVVRIDPKTGDIRIMRLHE